MSNAGLTRICIKAMSLNTSAGAGEVEGQSRNDGTVLSPPFQIPTAVYREITPDGVVTWRLHLFHLKSGQIVSPKKANG